MSAGWQSGAGRLLSREIASLISPALSGAQIEVDQTTNRACHGVDFGRPRPPSAAADRRLLIPPFPPALQRWTLLVVLSIKSALTLSKAPIRRNISCQMPALDQRLKRL